MDSVQTATALTGALALVWTAAWVDMRTFRIPNTLVLAGTLFGLLLQLWIGGLTGLGQGLLGMGLALAVFFPVYLIKHMGAGDVKLMAAIGALLGPERLLMVVTATVIAAGAIATGYALRAWRSKGARGPWKRYGDMLRFLWVTGCPTYLPPAAGEAMAERLPLAVPIALGTTVVLLWPT